MIFNKQTLTLVGTLLVVINMVAPITGVTDTVRLAPEFTHSNAEDWINSEPLTISSLRGSVVVVDFWTFECWNCYRSFPWLNSLEAKYREKGLRVIGVHSPEFEREGDRRSVVEKVAEFDLHHPVMIDNDFSYWRAMDNRYWPAYYLIDKKGRIRDLFVGETHAGDKRAKAIDARIAELMAE